MEPRDVDLEESVKEHRRDAGRSGEEIESLTVDENLSDLDRIKLFLSPTAHQVQVNCALEKLPVIFHEYKAAAYKALFPAFTTCLESFSVQNLIAAGEAIISIMEDATLPKDIGLWLLPTALSMIKSNRNHDVLRVWLKALCGIIPTLPEKMIKDDLMHLALSKGESQETVQSRTACCTILGAIAPLLEQREVKKNFLLRAMALCQDTDLEVRVCMCEQLNAISRAVGIETTTEKVLPELFELLKDEEIQVQNAAFKSLVQLLDFLPPDVRKTKILPFLRPFVAPNEAHFVIAVPHLMGELMCKMLPDLTEDEFELLLDDYKIFTCHSSEDVRQLCAANFPAVLKCVGARKYSEKLHPLYMQIVQDCSSFIRATIAASFHEVAKMLGKKRTSSVLKDPLILLLEDDSRDVQTAILKNLPSVLEYFSAGTPQQRGALYGALIPSMLRAEEAASIGKQWRLQLYLLHAFTEMPEYLSSDQIYESLVPICFRYMVDGVMPVKSAATMALATFIRVASSRMFKDNYLDAALLTLQVSTGGWGICSRKNRSVCQLRPSLRNRPGLVAIPKNNVFTSAVTQDPVPSVRIRACRMLPLLKYAIKLPDDVAFLEKINHLTTQRLNDSIKEVAATAHALTDGLKSSLRHAMHDREIPTEQAISQEEFDKIDRQREEEEWNMLSKEEQDEKKKLDEMLQRLKLEGNSRKTGPVIAGGGFLHYLSSPQADSGSRFHSKNSSSGRTTACSNGSRSNLSSTSSRPPQGDPSSRASVSKGPSRQSNSASGTSSGPASTHLSAHSSSASPPFSTTHVSSTTTGQLGQPGQPTRRRDTSFVGPRSSTYRMAVVAPPSARLVSPGTNLRPQTPSVTSVVQDLSDQPVPVPSSHVVGQRLAPAKTTKPNPVSRRTT